MDYLACTRTPDLDDPTRLAAAVAELYDREAIRALVALYSIARDDHDIDRLLAFFADDGVFDISGTEIRGHDDLRAFYVGNTVKYRTSNHVTHTHVIEVEGDTGRGLVTGHAELAHSGTLMIAGYRYTDDYARQGGRWLFARRRLRFMYAVPVEEMSTSFGDHLRIRWPGQAPIAADFPEGLPTFGAAAQ